MTEQGRHEVVKENLEEMTNEELMKHFQDGVVEAFNIIHRRFDQLQSYVQTFIDDEAVAEDIVQETWVRVVRNRHGYKPIAKLSTWLYKIAANLALSEYNLRKRRGPHDSIYKVSSEGDEYVDHLASCDHLPDDLLHFRMLGEELQRVINEIPEEFREFLILRDIQQLSYNEIAEITGKPLGTVKRGIHHGRRVPRKMMQLVVA